ncbi:MAG TPA: hypothetical protein VMR98_01235 [Candidatus Polarisedimenticolaceae bacterium]|nr:hypothetical protein [Candidatus Polarisedimenticolaceae bacterium]
MRSLVLGKIVVAGLATVGMIGGAFTLVHQSGSVAGKARHSNIDTSVDVAPSLSWQEVAATPSLDVKVNGTEIPMKKGTAKVDTGEGVATVRVTANSASVDTVADKNSDQTVSQDVQQGSANVSVHTSTVSSGNSNSSARMNSSSHTTVSGSGSTRSTVHVTSH